MEQLSEIIGIAENRKNGLVINGEQEYFVKNKHFWAEEFLDKPIKVKGIITITNNNALLTPDETNDPIKKQGINTYSWEDYHAQNTQYWIEIVGDICLV